MSIGHIRILGPILSFLCIGLLSLSIHVTAEPVDSVQQASEIVQEKFGGQVVKAEEADLDQKKVYVIRVVNEGRVRDVMIDPDDGSILEP